jgi:hypothetical protein
MIRVRFAPTPIGSLFVSGARVALANHLFVRRIRNGAPKALPIRSGRTSDGSGSSGTNRSANPKDWTGIRKR